MIPIYFLGFMGYDILPQAAQEVKAPIRKMVFVIPLSILFVFIAYMVIAITNAGVVPWEQLAKNIGLESLTGKSPAMKSLQAALTTPIATQ